MSFNTAQPESKEGCFFFQVLVKGVVKWYKYVKRVQRSRSVAMVQDTASTHALSHCFFLLCLLNLMKFTVASHKVA